jgi:hypothetical protein
MIYARIRNHPSISYLRRRKRDLRLRSRLRKRKRYKKS